MMGRRRKALESSLELTEDQHFQAVEAIQECLDLLDDLGEEIQPWACYSDFVYRYPEEWLVYMDEREEAAIVRLVRRN